MPPHDRAQRPRSNQLDCLWEPVGELDRPRWFRCLQQAFDADPVENFSWNRHGERTMSLYLSLESSGRSAPSAFPVPPRSTNLSSSSSACRTMTGHSYA